MIYTATNIIKEAMEEHDLKCTIHELGSASAVEVGIKGDDCSYELHFISTDDDTDVSIYTFKLPNVPEAKRPAVLEVLNRYNNRPLYFTFSIDSDGDLCATYHFPLNTPMEAVGEIAFEMVIRSMKHFDEVYTDVMRAIWS